VSTFTGSYILPEDDALLYLNDTGSTVFWFAEAPEESPGGHPSVRAASVFRGHRAGATVSGRWLDVPKGGTRTTGEVTLERVATTFGFPPLAVTSAASPFRSRTLQPSGRPGIDGSFVPAGFAGTAPSDLTGTWISDAGTSCYVRQAGNDVFWFGEKAGSDGVVDFAYVFAGLRHRDQLLGEWCDVPKGPALGHGNVRLKIDNDFTMRVTDFTGDPPDRAFYRVESFWVDVVINGINIVTSEDDIGADEPLIWFGFFRQDGASMNLAGPSTDNRATLVMRPDAVNEVLVRATGFRLSGGAGSGPDPDAGFFGKGTVPASLGTFKTVLKTVRGVPPGSDVARLATQIGFAVAAWDQDYSTTASTRRAFRAFESRLRASLDDRAQRLFAWAVPGASLPLSPAAAADAAGQAADDALLDYDAWSTDSHDYLDADARFWTFRDFRGAAIQPIHVELRGDGAFYELTGSVTPEFRALDPASL
jgi:hypothetical protein